MTGALHLTVADVLAQQDPTGPEFGKASPLGLAIVVLLLIGTVLLVWSMNKQLRKLPETFDADHPEADQAADEGTDHVAAEVADDPRADRTGRDGKDGSAA